MTLDTLTLGERMVMAARIAAAEHLRQAARAQGVDLAQLSTLLREAKMPPPINPAAFQTVRPIGRGQGEAA